MRIVLVLLLAGLAGVEYLYHRADGHGFSLLDCFSAESKSEGVRDMLRQHVHRH